MSLLDTAIQIAAEAHAGQKQKILQHQLAYQISTVPDCFKPRLCVPAHRRSPAVG